MTDPDLIRFVEAQAPILDQVERELRSGRKRTHWMWFIFPQFAGLGHSTMSQNFAITSKDQARRFLADPVLGKRLRFHIKLLMDNRGKTANQILGTPDDLKFKSCLTLFNAVAESEADHSLFKAALDRFYGGATDPKTMELLGGKHE